METWESWNSSPSFVVPQIILSLSRLLISQLFEYEGQLNPRVAVRAVSIFKRRPKDHLVFKTYSEMATHFGMAFPRDSH